MKKVRFIYNPYSGENAILKELDKIITMHQDKGYTIVPYRIQRGVDVINALDIVDSTYEYILIAGGDGTIDTVVNAMKKRGIEIPIGIIPVGTANDFAKHLGMPQDAGACVEQILDSYAVGVDLGKVNDNYFVNVLSTGLFTDVSQKTDTNLKNTIGKLAYYLKGLEELPKVQDGLLDIVIFKACHIPELIPMFIKVLKGEHLEDSRIEYIRTDELLIESDEEIVTDIDGERGPDFPLRVQCIKDGIQVLGINK